MGAAFSSAHPLDFSEDTHQHLNSRGHCAHTDSADHRTDSPDHIVGIPGEDHNPHAAVAAAAVVDHMLEGSYSHYTGHIQHRHRLLYRHNSHCSYHIRSFGILGRSSRLAPAPDPASPQPGEDVDCHTASEEEAAALVAEGMP